MKTYAEYTKRERSEMTEEQVKALLDAELMVKGVLKVAPPVLQKIEEVELRSTIYFEAGGVYFDTAEQAASFLKLNPKKDSYDYQVGYEIKYPEPLEQEIKQVKLYDRVDVLNAKLVLSKNHKAKEANEQEEKRYQEAVKKVGAVLDEVWSDWNRCRSLAYYHKKVVDTRAEYMKLIGGDEALAETFLRKAFRVDEIKASNEWFGLPEVQVNPPQECAVPVQEVPVQEKQSDEVPF